MNLEVLKDFTFTQLYTYAVIIVFFVSLFSGDSLVAHFSYFILSLSWLSLRCRLQVFSYSKSRSSSIHNADTQNNLPETLSPLVVEGGENVTDVFSCFYLRIEVSSQAEDDTSSLEAIHHHLSPIINKDNASLGPSASASVCEAIRNVNVRAIPLTSQGPEAASLLVFPLLLLRPQLEPPLSRFFSSTSNKQEHLSRRCKPLLVLRQSGPLNRLTRPPTKWTLEPRTTTWLHRQDHWLHHDWGWLIELEKRLRVQSGSGSRATTQSSSSYHLYPYPPSRSFSSSATSDTDSTGAFNNASGFGIHNSSFVVCQNNYMQLPGGYQLQGPGFPNGTGSGAGADELISRMERLIEKQLDRRLMEINEANQRKELAFKKSIEELLSRIESRLPPEPEPPPSPDFFNSIEQRLQRLEKCLRSTTHPPRAQPNGPPDDDTIFDYKSPFSLTVTIFLVIATLVFPLLFFQLFCNI
ncbi:hypothetical protein D9758_017270 [Tetrapyrgos nigripes]|uniref:Uncharacterized protein n=1 Tax=Tetrapyrgos nigripes TaxID=182062 RepID=A0A8H5FG68_9AGAR|nr:hypothetical protein D9758_017270 [Tetrapyrgos nigripes]